MELKSTELKIDLPKATHYATKVLKTGMLTEIANYIKREDGSLSGFISVQDLKEGEENRVRNLEPEEIIVADEDWKPIPEKEPENQS